MSEISRFFKKHKTVSTNVFYPATKSLCSEDGKPLEWEIRPITSKENERIQESCMTEVPIPGKPNQFRHKMNTSEYVKKLVVESVVYPDLHNAELQDSYGVVLPCDLVQEIIDNIGEWNNLVEFINKLNRIVPIQEDVNTVKN